MNLHQPVMEAHRDLVGRICLVLDPRLGVVKQLAQGHGNLVERNPEIALARPELARPPPYVAEHPAVQLLDEFLAQRITTAVERPILRARDVLLLRFVQLAASSVLQAGSSGRLCLYTRKRLPRERLRSSRHLGSHLRSLPAD
jgi:hypothetical protein